jgi:hypothetical protein
MVKTRKYKKPRKKTRKLNKQKGGSTLNRILNMEYDTFQLLLPYLRPEDIIQMYDSDPKYYEQMFVHIMQENPNFVLKFDNTIIPNKYRIMLEEKNIPLKLKEEHIVYDDGKQEWYRNGLIHRDNDLPAIILSNGDQIWCKNDKVHRDGDLPAIEYANGTKKWYQNGKLFRNNNLPTETRSNGDQMWHKNGLLHRDGDLPAYITSYCKEWYQNGFLHRDGDLPAIECTDRLQKWYQNGLLHREEGPAVINADYTQEWWLNNVQQFPKSKRKKSGKR